MTKDEKLDEFLKRIGIELLPFQKELIKKIADENKIYVCYDATSPYGFTVRTVTCTS